MSLIVQDYGALGSDIATQQLIAPVLVSMIADRAFSIGDQFIVNSVLYKATKSIAQGDTLSPGTASSNNCVVSDTITQQMLDMREGIKSTSIPANTTSSNKGIISLGLSATNNIAVIAVSTSGGHYCPPYLNENSAWMAKVMATSSDNNSLVLVKNTAISGTIYYIEP